MQCNEQRAFGLPFGERASRRDIRNATRAFGDFANILINDGDTENRIYRVTAMARYATPSQAEAMMMLAFATVIGEEQFTSQFSEGYIDEESVEDGVVFYSGDYDLNEGIALQIAHEQSTLIVTCTNLRGRAEAFGARAQ